MYRICWRGRYGRNTRIHGSTKCMYVSIISGETSNHMIHEKEAAKCEDIFGMDNSAVILKSKILCSRKRVFFSTSLITHVDHTGQMSRFGYEGPYPTGWPILRRFHPHRLYTRGL